MCRIEIKYVKVRQVDVCKCVYVSTCTSVGRAIRSFLPTRPREKFLPGRGFSLDHKSPIRDPGSISEPQKSERRYPFTGKMTRILLSDKFA